MANSKKIKPNNPKEEKIARINFKTHIIVPTITAVASVSVITVTLLSSPSFKYSFEEYTPLIWGGGLILCSILILILLGYLWFKAFIYYKLDVGKHSLESKETPPSIEVPKESIKLRDLNNILIPKTLSILLITFIVIFIFQFFSAYVGIQKTLFSISQIDNRIIYSPPKSFLIEGIPDAITISFLTLIVLAIGTISTQILSIRNDLRNKKDLDLKEKQLELNKQETELRIEKLELELADLKRKNEASTKLITEASKEDVGQLLLSGNQKS